MTLTLATPPEAGWIDEERASSPYTPCPTCGTHSKVREHITQATRQEPSRSLGRHGYCPQCDCSFKVIR